MCVLQWSKHPDSPKTPPSMNITETHLLMITTFTGKLLQTVCGDGIGMVLHTTALNDWFPSMFSVTAMESPVAMVSFEVVFSHI